MTLNRRRFLACAAGALAAGSAAASPARESGSPPDFSDLRADFPWAERETFLNNAGFHPLGVHSAKAARQYLDSTVKGPVPGTLPVGERQFQEVKELYGKLIEAKPSEIAFVQSTLAGENIVAAGLGLNQGSGNVVIDELHYHGGAHIYRMLQKTGLELRIIKQRDWRIELSDYERQIDKNTKLVAMTLVSNINGYLHDSKAVSDIAHAHGAYLYADIVQSAGCVPMDVRGMGIDFCSASTYKWLMGLRGLGFLYVREELQGDVLKTTRFGDRQYSNFEFHNFPGSPPGPSDVSYELRSGAARYEVGNISNIAVAAQRESLRYILNLGVENIRAHAKRLTDEILKEVPRLGYPSITPPGTPTPIVAFLVDNPERLRAKLKKANVAVKVKWRQMRVSPSVYNNQADVDRLLNALS